jgi:hypothetical protein
MRAALDPVPLLKRLEEHGVEYIVIGGLAVGAHGHVRPSMDLDIVPGPSQENLTRLAAALVNAKTVDAEANDFGQAERPMSTTRVKEHLCAMKRAAGRPQDLEDLRRLGAD